MSAFWSTEVRSLGQYPSDLGCVCVSEAPKSTIFEQIMQFYLDFGCPKTGKHISPGRLWFRNAPMVPLPMDSAAFQGVTRTPWTLVSGGFKGSSSSMLKKNSIFGCQNQIPADEISVFRWMADMFSMFGREFTVNFILFGTLFSLVGQIWSVPSVGPPDDRCNGVTQSRPRNTSRTSRRWSRYVALGLPH